MHEEQNFKKLWKLICETSSLKSLETVFKLRFKTVCVAWIEGKGRNPEEGLQM